jgi:hypothetical protein
MISMGLMLSAPTISRSDDKQPIFVKFRFPLNFVTAPLIADLFLLAILDSRCPETRWWAIEVGIEGYGMGKGQWYLRKEAKRETDIQNVRRTWHIENQKLAINYHLDHFCYN